MECGLDLVEARKKLAADAAQTGPVVTSSQQRVAVAATAAAGVATDVGEDTRLREFDHQLAERLRAERGAAILTAIIGLGVGLACLMTGLKLLAGVGGLKALGGLTPGYLKDQGFGMFGDQLCLGVMTLAVAVAGLLAFAGQVHRAWTGTQAIEDIRFGGRPRVVGISSFTVAGLVIASFIIPPLGLVLGIIFKLSKDDDTRDLGGKMVTAAIVAIALLIINVLIGLASGLKTVQPPATPEAPAE